MPNERPIWVYKVIKRSQTMGTNENIRKVKNRLRRKERMSARKLSVELDTSESVRRILKVDLGLRSYKKIIERTFSDDQKIKRKQFGN